MAAALSPHAPAAAPAGVSATLTRIALALTASLLSVFLRIGRAVAAERTVRAAAATSAAPFVLSGNMVKWGVVTVVLGGAYIFRREETPILTETVVAEEEPARASAASAEIDGLAVAAAAADAPPSPATNDVSLNADLFRRMQELASAKEAEDDEEGAAPPQPPSDSTDSWGVGNTAVLEPPKQGDEPSQPQGVLDGEPAVEFPPGFPLVDGEIETQPAASEDQIAMLQRMFGSSSEE